MSAEPRTLAASPYRALPAPEAPAGETVLRLAWFRAGSVPLVLIVLAMLAAGISMIASFAGRSSLDVLVITGALFALSGLVLLPVAVALVVNRTTVRAWQNRIQVSYGPVRLGAWTRTLPLGDERVIFLPDAPVRMVEHADVASPVAGGPRVIGYAVVLVLADGQRLQVLSRVPRFEQARTAIEALEECLGATVRPEQLGPPG